MSAGASEPGGEIVCRRRLRAPAAEVFAAYREPGRLAQWWGPAGCTNTFHEFDFRPGGAWRFTMRGPDGREHHMDHRFMAIAPGERIVVRHLQAGHDFELAMELAERPDGTELTWRMRFDDPAETERLRSFLLGANEQNLDRLEAHLAGRASVNRAATA